MEAPTRWIGVVGARQPLAEQEAVQRPEDQALGTARRGGHRADVGGLQAMFVRCAAGRPGRRRCAGLASRAILGGAVRRPQGQAMASAPARGQAVSEQPADASAAAARAAPSRRRADRPAPGAARPAANRTAAQERIRPCRLHQRLRHRARQGGRVGIGGGIGPRGKAPRARWQRGADLREVARHLGGVLVARCAGSSASPARSPSSSAGGTPARTGQPAPACRAGWRSAAAPRLAPLKAGRPVTISYSMEPSEKMSLRWSTGWPPTCSGDMYLGEPIIVPLWVRTSDACMRAMPKSMIFAWPSGQQHDVAGLDVAVHDAARVRRRQRRGHLRRDVQRPRAAAAGPSAIRSRSSVPCSSSIAMYSQSPSRPRSWMVMMSGVVQAAGGLGFLAEARLQLCARSPASSGSSRVLTATCRCSDSSSARYTTPMAPRPSSRTTR